MRLPGYQAKSLLPQIVLIPYRARLKFDRLKDKVNTFNCGLSHELQSVYQLIYCSGNLFLIAPARLQK